MPKIKPADIVTLPELEKLFPPPSDQALAKHDESLMLEGGAISDVWVWRNENSQPVLVDGHTRIRRCKALGLPHPSIREVFPDAKDLEEVKYRIRLAAVGQRNMPPAAERFNIGCIVKYQVEAKGDKPTAAVRSIATEADTTERRVWRAYEQAKLMDEMAIDASEHPGTLDLSVQDLKQVAKLDEKARSETLKRSGGDSKAIKKDLRQFTETKGNPLYDEAQEARRAKAKKEREVSAKKGVFKVASESVGRAGKELTKLKEHGVAKSKVDAAYKKLRDVGNEISEWAKQAGKK